MRALHSDESMASLETCKTLQPLAACDVLMVTNHRGNYLALKDNPSPKPRRKRPSRAFQTNREQQLQRWLDFAALLDFERALPSPWEADMKLMQLVLERGARPERSDTISIATKTMGQMFFPFGAIFDVERGAHDFYAFFWTVRSAFEWMVDTWTDRENWPDFIGSNGQHPISSFAIPSDQAISMSKLGLVVLQDNPVWQLFRGAIQLLDLGRLRRCPVCRRIYYAWRANKGACDQHLGLARVWRKRGKLPEYNASRRFRKKAGLKGVRGNARSDVLSLSKALQNKGDADE
jgi:hypothetical protein